MRYSDYLKGLERPPLLQKERTGKICLDKNEPPFSAFAAIEGVLDDSDMQGLRTYPDLYELYEKLAAFSGVEVEYLLVAQGSEQALKSIFDVFVEAGDEVVYHEPSFTMYDVYCYQKKAFAKRLPFTAEMKMDADEVCRAVTEKTRLLVLINPHNFTGTSLSMEAVERIAAHTCKTGTLLLLDEAYYHYLSLPTTSLLERYGHIIITRTFSKALGIAGARVGYAISTPQNIALLRKVKPIDEIDALAGKTAIMVLKHSDAILERNLSQVKKWKKIFRDASFEGITYLETEANFILLRSEHYLAHKQMLLENGILPKLDFSASVLQDCIRFSVADDKVMDRILQLFSGVTL